MEGPPDTGIAVEAPTRLQVPEEADGVERRVRKAALRVDVGLRGAGAVVAFEASLEAGRPIRSP